MSISKCSLSASFSHTLFQQPGNKRYNQCLCYYGTSVLNGWQNINKLMKWFQVRSENGTYSKPRQIWKLAVCKLTSLLRNRSAFGMKCTQQLRNLLCPDTHGAVGEKVSSWRHFLLRKGHSHLTLQFYAVFPHSMRLQTARFVWVLHKETKWILQPSEFLRTSLYTWASLGKLIQKDTVELS